MRFTPTPLSELKKFSLLPNGPGDFEVLKAEDKTFPSGPGIKLTLGVYGPNGGQKWIDDNLIFTEKTMFKVAQFCEATGMMDKYEAGELSAADCIHKTGKCRVKIEEREGYEPRNVVNGYIAPKKQAAAQPPESISSEIDAKAADFDPFA